MGGNVESLQKLRVWVWVQPLEWFWHGFYGMIILKMLFVIYIHFIQSMSKFNILGFSVFSIFWECENLLWNWIHKWAWMWFLSAIYVVHDACYVCWSSLLFELSSLNGIVSTQSELITLKLWGWHWVNKNWFNFVPASLIRVKC